MDCIIWACGLARTPEDELPPPMPGTSLQPEEIDKEEKNRIRTIQLDESESEPEGSEQEEPTTDTEHSVEEGEIEDTNSTCLEKSLEKNCTSARTTAMSQSQAEATCSTRH